MHSAEKQVPLDAWISVSQLANAEGVSRREIYNQIDHGMAHSRIGRRIRVRRQDWYTWDEAHVVKRPTSGGAPTLEPMPREKPDGSD